MSRLLFTVEEAFELRERGVVLAPSVPEDKLGGVRPGSAIELRCEGRPVLKTTVLALMHLHPVDKGKTLGYGVILPKDVSKSDVTVGTEVWLL